MPDFPDLADTAARVRAISTLLKIAEDEDNDVNARIGAAELVLVDQREQEHLANERELEEAEVDD